MRYIIVTLIALFIVLFASSCIKESGTLVCDKVWQKNLLPSVQVDTSDGLSLILPYITVTGNNAVLFLDSIKGDFRAELNLKNILTGDKDGMYFRMVVSNDSAGKIRQVIAGLYTTSDSLKGLQLATIINASGDTPNGDFSNYTQSLSRASHYFYIARTGNHIFCSATSTRLNNSSLKAEQLNKGYFNTDMCALSLELGSINSNPIQDSVAVTLTNFSLKGSSITPIYDYFRCNTIK